MGKTLDLHWLFAEPGDTHLGRILAGLDPNEECFGSLPPHWKVDNPMGNTKIREAMNLMFATILQRWGGKRSASHRCSTVVPGVCSLEC